MKKLKTETIIEMYQSAIMAEKEAREKRLELETLLYDSVSSQLHKSEGQETLHVHGYSITVDRPMTAKIIEAEYNDFLMEYKMPFHRTKIEIDKKKFNALVVAFEENKSAYGKKLLRAAQNCVEIKPGKISVKVEGLKNEN